ncbi:MAG TPA: succinate dehydrogenase flavoprotein subunit [Planctomycetota bacterium]|nr:succinate dehydrogenase flavoprotein subunit [Planctomycetota bacterium]
MAEPSIIIVGGGLAGLMAAIRVAEKGGKVSLFSVVPVKRSHSVCAQGGINGAVNTKGEGDSPLIHFDDSVYGGDFLANQPPVKAMTAAAPRIIYLLDRMGVPFNRTPEGLLDFRRFGGTLHHRTAFAGATTGQQLLYALDEQVRRYEAEGRVEKFESWEYLSAVLDDDGRARGIVAQNLATMEVRGFRGDAVILATGGPGRLFGRSTNSTICTGFAAASLYRQGAKYANGEFIQIHPTAIPAEDKLRLMSESARGEGGRVWVPRKKGDVRPPEAIPESERWYFLEEKYPKYGNLVPRDIASREIHRMCFDLGMGLGGGARVYLDLTHKPKEVLDKKLGGILEIYEKFVGVDPRHVPMQIFPAVHYSMGGLWCGYTVDAHGEMELHHPKLHMTNLEGVYAAGEVDYQYHGANRLGANSLVSCIFSGECSGNASLAYVKSLKASCESVPQAVYDREVARQNDELRDIASQSGGENPYQVADELGVLMTAECTIVRTNAGLAATLKKLDVFAERARRATPTDPGGWSNQSIRFCHQLRRLVDLGKIVAAGALARDESRGAHYKPEFEARDDERFLKTTLATYDPTSDGPKLSYEDVDVRFIKPRPRTYGAVSS